MHLYSLLTPPSLITPPSLHPHLHIGHYLHLPLICDWITFLVHHYDQWHLSNSLPVIDWQSALLCFIYIGHVRTEKTRV